MIRLELSTQIGDQVSSFLQVCDGKCLWTYRKLFDETTLTRVDAVRAMRVLQAMAAAPGRDPAATLPGLGGLSRLLRGLDANFCFTTAELGRVKQPVKYLPVWKLEGGWRPAQLVRLLPQQKAAIEQGKPVDTTRLSKHLPDRVVLLLGQEDLFPYRIEYRRQVDKKEASEGEETRSLVTMELYEVNLNALAEPTRFLYNPGSMEPEDQTESFLLSLGGEVSEALRVDRRVASRPLSLRERGPHIGNLQ